MRGFVQNKALKIGGAAVLVVSAFGFLFRDCVNFGKMEGDTKPAKIAVAEKKAEKEFVLRFGNLDTELSESDVYSVIAQINSFREEIRLCEDRKKIADYCRESGNLDGALMNLGMIQTRLENMEKEAEKLSKQGVITNQFSNLLVKMLEILNQDVSMEIAKLTHKLQKNNIPCVLAAGDTFRAASIEQLKKHGDKLGIKIVRAKLQLRK